MNFTVRMLESGVVLSGIILLLFGASAVFRKFVFAKARYWMWIILLVGLIVPFRPLTGATMFTVENPFEAISAEMDQTQDIAAQSAGLSEPGAQAVQSSNVGNDALTAQPVTELSDRILQTSLTLSDLLIAIWAAGAIVVSVKHIREYRGFLRLIRRWGRPVTDERLLTLFEKIKSDMNIQSEIKLIVCDFIGTPMLTGLFKPVVLLPKSDLHSDEMALILEHELTHYKHKDLWVNLLGILVLAIHWFNPIIYLSLPMLYAEAEAYCDEDVLKNKNKEHRRFYGELIISMIGLSAQRPVALSTCFYTNKVSIKRRLMNIMETNNKKKKLSGAAVALTLCATLASGSLFAFAAPVGGNIGAEKAKTIALKDAGLKASEVSFVRVKLEKDDGVAHYDVEFYKGNVEYDYEIAAKSGAILEKDTDIENYSVPSAAQNQTTASSGSASGSNSSGSGTTSSTKSSAVTTEQAKTIALNHAGLKASQVSYMSVKTDYENGVKVYEVDFYSSGVEYDYDIEVATGKILSYDQDYDD